jgi:NADH:ubiquinone oxidoreductase subunit F (NADH-binding)/NADH:ubiquinone oxidoreductase subunit E
MSLIQELRRIQDKHHYLPPEELKALAERARVPPYRIQELVSFFPHFRTNPPAAVEVQVCRDTACHLRGARELVERLRTLPASGDKQRLTIEGVSCLGRCDRAPVACINHRVYAGRPQAQLVSLVQEFLAGKTPPPDRDGDQDRDTSAWNINPYRDAEPYEAVRRFLALSEVEREKERNRIVEELRVADVRGMGGAGEEAYKKWTEVRRGQGDPKYVVCNGDESEPATFKDRELLLRLPHLVVEGVILAALVVGAGQAYFYIRHEYPEQIHAIREAIEDARRRVALPVRLEDVFVSPGGYICGEQSALVEAMEDRRAEPRNRPPQLATNGLWDRPTLLSNVETFAWAPVIALRGGAWYRGQGRNGRAGRRFFSVCGDVQKPGVYEVPIGLTVGELVHDFAGGMLDGKPLKALACSGPSGGFLPRKIPVAALARGYETRVPERFLREKLPAGATHLDVLNLELDLQLFRDLGLMLGAGLVVYGEGTDLVEQAVNCLEFFRNESCGKCVPCRIGSQKLVEIGTRLRNRDYDRTRWDEQERLVAELARAMEMTSICGLGQVAPAPLTALIRRFPEELNRYVTGVPPS